MTCFKTPKADDVLFSFFSHEREASLFSAVLFATSSSCSKILLLLLERRGEEQEEMDATGQMFSLERSRLQTGANDKDEEPQQIDRIDRDTLKSSI